MCPKGLGLLFEPDKSLQCSSVNKCKISNFRTLTEVVHLLLSLPVVSDLPLGSK